MDIWHAVTFRNSPNEYADTHAVLVAHFISASGDKWLPKAVLCEKELPETMREDISGFQMYIDKNRVSCNGCQTKARGFTR